MTRDLHEDRGSETRGLGCERSTNRLHLLPIRDHKILRAAARRSAVYLLENRLEQLEIVLRPLSHRWNAGNLYKERHRRASGKCLSVVPYPASDRPSELQPHCPGQVPAAAPKLPL